jgi:hypothetical protein
MPTIFATSAGAEAFFKTGSTRWRPCARLSVQGALYRFVLDNSALIARFFVRKNKKICPSFIRHSGTILAGIQDWPALDSG